MRPSTAASSRSKAFRPYPAVDQKVTPGADRKVGAFFLPHAEPAPSSGFACEYASSLGRRAASPSSRVGHDQTVPRSGVGALSRLHRLRTAGDGPDGRAAGDQARGREARHGQARRQAVAQPIPLPSGPPVDPALKTATAAMSPSDPVLRFYQRRNFKPAWNKAEEAQRGGGRGGAARRARGPGGGRPGRN